MSDTDKSNTAQTIASLGAALAELQHSTDGAPYLVVPEGYSVERMEHLLDRPTRKRGEVEVRDVESFNRYFTTFAADTGTCRIYADPGDRRIVGVLNDHAPGHRDTDADWCDHRVVYQPQFSEEWKRWTNADGKVMDQASFARFLEENVIDVVEPAAADMLDTARGLEVHESSTFKQATRLHDGAMEFTWDTDVQGQVKGRQNLKVPTEFTICVPIFFNGMLYKVRCFLRYRKSPGGVAFFYEIHRRVEAELDAFKLILDEIEHGGAPRVATKDAGHGVRADGSTPDTGDPDAPGFAGTGVRPILGVPPRV